MFPLKHIIETICSTEHIKLRFYVFWRTDGFPVCGELNAFFALTDTFSSIHQVSSGIFYSSFSLIGKKSRNLFSLKEISMDSCEKTELLFFPNQLGWLLHSGSNFDDFSAYPLGNKHFRIRKISSIQKESFYLFQPI